MSKRRIATLSDDPERFRDLLLAGLSARDPSSLLDELSRVAADARASGSDRVLIEFLEAVAITHALNDNADYRSAVRDVEGHAHEEPVPADLEALRKHRAASA